MKIFYKFLAVAAVLLCFAGTALGAACVIGIRRTSKEKPDYLDEQYTMEELDSVLGRADIVAMVLPGGEATLYLAASTLYRLWVNGAFAGAGPARAAHGYYCVDCVELTDRLNREKNVVVIEVLGCNVNTYDTLDQPSFLTAEILRDHQPVLWTGDSHFQAYDLKQRVQRIQRYSFQRAFTECYHLRTENQSFYENADWRGEHTAVTPEASCSALSSKVLRSIKSNSGSSAWVADCPMISGSDKTSLVERTEAYSKAEQISFQIKRYA